MEERTRSGLSIPRRIEEGVLVIEKSLGPEIVFSLAARIDKEAGERGLIDPVSGYRKPMAERPLLIPEKLRVEKFFAEKGTLYPILPMDDQKVVLEMFDEPEKLSLVTDPYSSEVIGLAHTRDREYMQIRQEVTNEVLLEKGLTVSELTVLAAKDPGTFDPIFQAVTEEAKKRLL